MLKYLIQILNDLIKKLIQKNQIFYGANNFLLNLSAILGHNLCVLSKNNILNLSLKIDEII